MLVANFGEHGLESLLVFGQLFGVVVVEVEPDLGSETYSGRRLRGDESEPVELLRHLEVLTHQVENQPFVNLVAFLRLGHLEHQSAPVLVFRVLPTGLDSLLEKLN